MNEWMDGGREGGKLGGKGEMRNRGMDGGGV